MMTDVRSCLFIFMFVGAQSALFFACKPSSEPGRHDLDATVQGTVDTSASGSASRSVVQFNTNAPAAMGDVSMQPPAPQDTAPPVDTAIAPTGVAGVDLPEHLVRLALQPSTARAQATAKRLNAKALKRHRRLKLEDAITIYRDALAAWPGHPFSNYNLACALALSRQPDAALARLALLTHLGPAGEERLRAARLDRDFESLQNDQRFRQLTGFVPVSVTWSPSLDRRSIAASLASVLRDSSIAAKQSAGPWRADVTVPTLLVQGDSVAAQTAASAIRDRLSLRDLVEQRSATVDGCVLVLAGSGGAPGPGDANSAGSVSGGRPLPSMVSPSPSAIERFVGKTLRGRDGDDAFQLRLKKSGFFKWDHSLASGETRRWTGKFSFGKGLLRLRYKEVHETPAPDGGAPEVSIAEGIQRELPVEATASGLTIEGVEYAPRAR